jgi:hypothetical protein
MFLHIENISLLWQLLQKSPYLIEFSQNARPGYKEIWFRGVSEQFYEKWLSQNSRIPSNSKELLEMNKQALQYMVLDLKRLLGYSSIRGLTTERRQVENSSIHGLTTERSQVENFNPAPILKPVALSDMPSYNVAAERQQREELRSAQFNNYQTEYNRLLEKPQLPDTKLPSLSGDDKITNMEELVKQHLMLRDMDLAIYSKDDDQQPPSPLVNNTNKHVVSTKLKIMEEIENADIEIRDFAEVPRSVHWA